jgi:uncharacterized protein
MEVFAEFDAYRPRTEWYLRRPHGMNGFGHAARVLVWADHIAREEMKRGRVLDLEVVRWAAALHVEPRRPM